MRILRVVLVVATLIAIIASPVLLQSAASSSGHPSTFALGSMGLDPRGRA